MQRSGFLRKAFFSLEENSNINPLLQTLQLVLTHLELDIGSAKANPPLGLAYSQFAVYCHPDDFPMFNFDFKWQVSINLLLHIANFWKHHMTRKDESTLYELFSQLQEHEKPKAWKSRLVQGDDVERLGKHWKGTYGTFIVVPADRVRELNMANAVGQHTYMTLTKWISSATANPVSDTTKTSSSTASTTTTVSRP